MQDMASFLPGSASALFGLPGAGKTTWALERAAELLAQGWSVNWLNLSEHAEGMLERARGHLGDAATGSPWVLTSSLDWGKAIEAFSPKRESLMVIDYLQMAGTAQAEAELLDAVRLAIQKSGARALVLAQTSRLDADSKAIPHPLLATALGGRADIIWLLDPNGGARTLKS